MAPLLGAPLYKEALYGVPMPMHPSPESDPYLEGVYVCA